MIKFVAVHKLFGALAELSDVNAEVKKGEVVVGLRAVRLGQVDAHPHRQ
ncbi:hypothetical protein [Bradyrhizobium yuanmingense]